jgi:hypothetical protein
VTPQLKKRPKPFVLASFSQKRNKAEANERMSHTLLSMASDDRIRGATPSLKQLYEFLARPQP